jgi:hypothetical protein
MVGDDAIDPREAESAMAILGGEKGLENTGQHGGLDADAVVGNFDTNVGAGEQMGRAILGGGADFKVSCLEGDASVWRHGLDRVLDDLDEGLLHLGLVMVDAEDLSLEFKPPGQGVVLRMSGRRHPSARN